MENCVTFNGCCLVSLLLLLFWITVIYTVHVQNWNLKLSKLEVIFVPWITDIYPCVVTSPRSPCEMLRPGQTTSTIIFERSLEGRTFCERIEWAKHWSTSRAMSANSDQVEWSTKSTLFRTQSRTQHFISTLEALETLARFVCVSKLCWNCRRSSEGCFLVHIVAGHKVQDSYCTLTRPEESYFVPK